MLTCFFIGHRDSGEEIYPILCSEVERHIVEYGVGEFIVGHYGRFDGMAARAVRKAKENHPEILLTLLLPYLDRTSPSEGFDGSVYPDGLELVPRKYAIARANQMMIDRCDCLIAHVNRTYGGAFRCLKYARGKRIAITRIQGLCQTHRLDP